MKIYENIFFTCLFFALNIYAIFALYKMIIIEVNDYKKYLHEKKMRDIYDSSKIKNKK
jgi:hypothetical protein